MKRLPCAVNMLAMDQSCASQNRQSNRSPVLLSATIELQGKTIPVRLRNLSEQGALIEAAGLPPQASSVLFARNDLRLNAQVMWAEGNFVGLRFERHLEREELLRQVPKPKQKFEQKFRRPGLTSEPLSDSDRRMIQMWGTPAPFRD